MTSNPAEQALQKNEEQLDQNQADKTQPSDPLETELSDGFATIAYWFDKARSLGFAFHPDCEKPSFFDEHQQPLPGLRGALTLVHSTKPKLTFWFESETRDQMAVDAYFAWVKSSIKIAIRL